MTPRSIAPCAKCPRLVRYRLDLATQHPDWHNKPVMSLGGTEARLLILGLAPGMTGANRTGRVFTGDGSGALLFEMLAKFGFSNDRFHNRASDGLILRDCMITNVVRCVPPENKPVAAEIRNCQPNLLRTLETLKHLRAVLCLGKIAHDALLRALGQRLAAYPFGHGVRHDVAEYAIFDSYHCSRYNLNTGRLTPAMFEDVFAACRRHIDGTEQREV